MRFADLARLVTPVTATPQPRARVVPLADATPDSGARWGHPSLFSYSNEAAKQGEGEQSISNRTPSGRPAEYMRIIPADLRVASQRVRVRSPADENVWVEIDRLRRMVFHYTEHLPRSSPGGLTPTRTTYFDLSFDLHPSPAEEAEV